VDPPSPAMPSVAILGSGYVGLCTGVVLAEHGHDVTLVDVDPERVEAVRSGRPPFHEPGLERALRAQLGEGRLAATTHTAAAVHAAEVTLLCVGTPTDDDGSADLSAVEQAARDVGDALAEDPDGGEHVLAVKSTVPPGTTEDVVAPAARAPLDDPDRVRVAMTPEFLREGSALADARDPDKVVVGARDEATREALASLWDVDAPTVLVEPGTAELIKYANNALLASKVTFANEMANLSEEVGADWREVADAVGLDDRLSGRFLRAGLGFGGSCFPKDVRAIAHQAEAAGRPSRLLEAVLTANEDQPLRAVELLEDELGEIDGARVALLGLAFKPGTDDARNTRAAPLADALAARGATVVGHDPQARETFRELRPDVDVVTTVEAALDGTDAAVVQTAWPQYGDLAPSTFTQWMPSPVVVDGRRALDEARFVDSEVRYRAIGLGRRDG